MRLSDILFCFVFDEPRGFGARPCACHAWCAQLLPDFKNYNYASPNALQGRTLKQAQIGSFDSLNPFSIRGNAAKNIRERVFESLLDRHYDEPFALYGLLAEKVTAALDRSSVTFTINGQAKFADGQPVTAADVAFSWQLLRDQGRPIIAIIMTKWKR